MKPNFLIPAFILGLIQILGLIMMFREPGLIWMWAIAMLMLPVAWFLLERLRFKGTLDQSALDDQKTVRWSVSAASIMIVIPLSLTVVYDTGLAGFSDTFEQRLAGIVFGIVLVGYGNLVQKRPASLGKGIDNAARQQTTNRQAARIFVITGFAYIAVWCFVHINYTVGFSMVVLVAMVIMIAGNALRRHIISR